MKKKHDKLVVEIKKENKNEIEIMKLEKVRVRKIK